VNAHATAERIDALLPQTQCTRCGYPTCRAYADAIATGEADIDRCPPGGMDGVAALARLHDREPKPLDPACGVEAPPSVALIDEAACIGCTKCIRACPVDAIVGASKRMHTVIADECTGCGLCVPPCPVDCISLPVVAAAPMSRPEILVRAAQARERFRARNVRFERERRERAVRRAGARTSGATSAPISREAVLAAIARGRARRRDLPAKPAGD
jgi:electron transport complex protein RnfB